MDSLSYQKLNMTAPCAVTYDKTGLISELGKATTDTKSDDFQKLMEKAQPGQPDDEVQDQPKAKGETAAVVKKDKAPAQKKPQDPVEESKQLQVWLTPVDPSVLQQYPAEWIPQVEEGEPIVCIGVRTDENGQQVPILVGANEAAKLYGREIVAPEAPELPQTIDVSDPEADAMLEATDPTVEHGPAQILEQVVDDQIDNVVRQAVTEEPQPESGEDDDQVEITELHQAPQRVFHDVEAAPVKVGEVYDAEQVDEVDVLKQVNDQIAQAVQQGESTVTVKITPKELGEVTVQISMKSDGVLSVAISARNEDTRTLLERHSANLQEMLSSRVRETVEVEVQRQQESQQSQQQNYEGHNGHAQQDGQEQRRPRREQASSQDFMQQLRLGLIPSDGDF